MSFEYFNQQRKKFKEKPGTRIDGRKKEEEVSPILIHLTIFFFFWNVDDQIECVSNCCIDVKIVSFCFE